MAETQVFKMLRDQYKFFRRTKRYETFITELDADQKARLFAGGKGAFISLISSV